MAPMKKTRLQGPRPRVPRTQSDACLQGYKPQSPGDAEQGDGEYPTNNNYDTKLLEQGNADNNVDNGGREYPTKYPTKYSVSWARSRSRSSYEGSDRFAMDEGHVAHDGDQDHNEGNVVVVEDVPPSKFSQNRCQNYVNRSREYKPYFGKRRHQTQEDHRCPPRAWENPRGTQDCRSSNQWIRNGHESRSPNFFKGSQSSPMVHGGDSPRGRFVKPPSSSLHFGEPSKEQIGLNVTEPKRENSIPPATPPLETVDSRKKLATQLHKGHGQVGDENLENAVQGVSTHTSIDNTKKEEVALHEDHGDQTKGKKERHSIAGGSSNHARKWSSTLVSLSFVIFGIVFEIFAK